MNNNKMQPVTNSLDVALNETFISFSPDTFEGKKEMYNAINNPDKRINEMINMEIRVRDVILTGVELANSGDDRNSFEDNPFDKRKAIRTIIIDDEGRSYVATSDGIATSIRSLYSVFGTLHFDEPVTVVVKQITVKKGTMLTLMMK